MNKNNTIVLGIGNPLLQDDRAGLEVVRIISQMNLPVDTEEFYTVGFEVMDRLMEYERAFVVDACCLDNKPGTVLEVGVDDIFSSHTLSNSHAITLGATIKTGYELFPEEMPADLTIILIEIERVDEFTDVMTLPVQKAVDRAVQMIISRFTETSTAC
jgi:hydrogenase maturation protease